MKFSKNELAWFVRRQLLAKPSPNSEPGPIVVAGLFSTSNGIGRAARGTHYALQELGIESFAIDLSERFQVSDIICPIETLSQFPPERSGTLILHLNGPETLDGLYAMKLFRPRKWRVIGYWSWELPTLPADWKAASRYLSEIWTLSSFCKKAIEQEVSLSVKVVPPFLRVPDDKSSQTGLNCEGIRCLIMADGKSSLSRKNLRGSIDVFLQAFPADPECRLVLKLQNIDALEYLDSSITSDPRITVITKKLSDEGTWELFRETDVIISAHRAEGFGLHLAEGMALGKTVIATQWSGNTDFMTASNSIPIPHTLTPIIDEYGIYSEYSHLEWAEPELKAASKRLRELAKNVTLRKRLGDQAMQDIHKHCAAEKYRTALAID